MATTVLKVGDLARRTGLSVRTLHHYDEIGLLSPSLRSESGHRLYGAADVARLQQVVSLRQLGLSLEEIRACLDGPDGSPLAVVRMHLGRLREQVRLQQRLCRTLETLAGRLERAEEVSVEEFIQAIEEMKMFEKYYTPEQLEELARRREQVGEERIKQVEAEWPVLMAQVQAEMDKGTDPADPVVQELARRWRALVNEFTGGNAEIERSVKSMWQNETNIHGIDTGPVKAMGEYIARALAAGNP